jgi:hypothetical protein
MLLKKNSLFEAKERAASRLAQHTGPAAEMPLQKGCRIASVKQLSRSLIAWIGQAGMTASPQSRRPAKVSTEEPSGANAT